MSDDVSIYDDWDEPLKPMSQYPWTDDPKKSPNFQVQTDDDDQKFLKQIDMDAAPFSRRLDTKFDRCVTDEVAYIIMSCMDCAPILGVFQKLSKNAKDTAFYHSVIKAAATLVVLLYSKEYLYELAYSDKSKNHLRSLWEEYREKGKQGLSIDQVCQSIVYDKIGKRYTYLTEADLSEFITSYKEGHWIPFYFDCSYEGGPYRPRIDVNSPLFLEIKEVVSKIESYPQLEVDDYSWMLIQFAYEDNDPTQYQEMLIAVVVNLVDSEAMYQLNPKILPPSYDIRSHEDLGFRLMILLWSLISDMQNKMRNQLVTLTRPFKYSNDCESLRISPYIFEIIEVAELRRRALGCQFIRRNHLVWAFYACGYGLPPKVRETIDLSIAGEDHPPYHVYLTSIKLAESLVDPHPEGLAKKMQIEHFVFTMLYCKDGFMGCEMKGPFNNFLKAVELDRVERPVDSSKSKPNSIDTAWPFMSNYSIGDWQDALKSIKMEDLKEDIKRFLGPDQFEKIWRNQSQEISTA